MNFDCRKKNQGIHHHAHHSVTPSLQNSLVRHSSATPSDGGTTPSGVRVGVFRLFRGSKPTPDFHLIPLISTCFHLFPLPGPSGTPCIQHHFSSKRSNARHFADSSISAFCFPNFRSRRLSPLRHPRHPHQRPPRLTANCSCNN